ncbi:PRC-barrel domain-containing protein [Pontibacter anaerobius]|uniref:PRC-barrel domain-containing protein n=1 Tax=Pontibacter anaerobius TaxID=2993940 RepID=A0ABT3RBQ4_9BACT|nr:PRC-barrel domain-containing protein [Pontibacter anaerobius]MCX2739039.1 PRC-barrel domain-containing protein [Pontibacter anaerobius]
MNNDELRNERLVPLSAMKDYKVAKDNPDVLGWRVVGADGESLGMVKDMIVDTEAMKVRYLSVVADRRFFNADSDQYLLVPIGVAALDKKGKKVFISAIDSRTVGSYPIYPGGPITEDYEYAVRDTLQRSQRDTMPGTAEDHRAEFNEALEQPHKSRPGYISGDFYNDATFDENRFYTSDQEVHREKNYANRDHDRDEEFSTADLHSEERRPKTVEDSINTIERLEHLREKGSITEEEFILLKKRALDL